MSQNTKRSTSPVVHLCPHSHAWYARGRLNLLGVLFLLPVVSWQIFLTLRGQGFILAEPLVFKVIITLLFAAFLELITSLSQRKRTWAESDFLLYSLLLVLSLPITLPLPVILVSITFAYLVTKWLFQSKVSLVPFVSTAYAYAYFTNPTLFQAGSMTAQASSYVSHFLTNNHLDSTGLLWLTSIPGYTLNTFIIGYTIVAILFYCFRIIDFRIPLASLVTYFLLLVIGSKTEIIFSYPQTIFALMIVSGDTRVGPFSNIGKWIWGVLIGIITVVLQLTWNADIAGFFAILFAAIFCPIIDSLLQPILLKQVKKTYEVLL